MKRKQKDEVIIWKIRKNSIREEYGIPELIPDALKKNIDVYKRQK